MNSNFWKFKILSVAMLVLTCSNASALGQVSRACRYDTIPEGLQNISARFFYAIGAPSFVKSIPQYDVTEKSHYWILESLTTDYLRARYYLFAMNWALDQPFPPAYRLIQQVASPWDAKEIAARMKTDPYFAPYYANRGDLFSARAGDPNIVVRVELPYAQILSLGAHYFYDPNSKTTTRLPDSSARDCNLSNWGYGTGLWGR
jgi:hypothetical protein